MPQVRAQAVSKLKSVSGCTLKGRPLHVLAEIKNSTALVLVFARPLLNATVEGVLFLKVSSSFARVKLWLVIGSIWNSGGNAKMIHIH